MIETRLVTGPHGQLEFSIGGPADGLPLIYHHGTPMSGQLYEQTVATSAARGVRMISYSRPGYADSARHAGRGVADCAADVEALLDALGIERCYTAGVSGGGPHALATAALLPERVVAAATLASIAPWGAEGLDFLEGMGPENHQEFGAALGGEAELRPLLDEWGATLVKTTGPEFAASLGELVSEVDNCALTGAYADYAAGSCRASLRHGVEGWLDDDIAFTSHWGFELDAITVPVTVWQGQQDRFVPPSHAVWISAHVPTASSRLLADQGHLSLELSQWVEILADLLSAAA